MTKTLARIQAAGIRLELHAGKLTFQGPPEAMTSERRAWLQRHKAELLEVLRTEAAPAPDTCGPCIHCGAPVSRHDGLRNWYGDLVHLRCPMPARRGPDEPERSVGA